MPPECHMKIFFPWPKKPIYLWKQELFHHKSEAPETKVISILQKSHKRQDSKKFISVGWLELVVWGFGFFLFCLIIFFAKAR